MVLTNADSVVTFSYLKKKHCCDRIMGAKCCFSPDYGKPRHMYLTKTDGGRTEEEPFQSKHEEINRSLNQDYFQSCEF